jgi:uncharacterized protein YdaU (DUF1376 family)
MEGGIVNFYKHHIGDYDQATRHLSFVEDAAYSRLIRKYYAEEAPLPKDLKKILRLIGARTKEEKAAVEVVLEEFFELGEDGYHNSRCDRELEAKQAKAELNRQVGKLGGRPKKSETQKEPTNNPNGYETETITVSEKTLASNQKPVTNNQKEEKGAVVDLAPVLDDAQHVASPVSRSIEIAVYLRQRGIVGANSANPNISAWGDDARVTNEILDAALSMVAARNLGKPVGPNYLATIIPDLLNPKPAQAQKQRDDWFRSPKGIERKASELGIYARAGETHDALRERCEAELRRRAQGVAA